MARTNSFKRWGFFILLTLSVAVILGGAYLWLGGWVRQQALAQHQRQMGNQLNLWQEQLYDTKWDSLADTGDDTLHLGHQAAAPLLNQTLRWYVYPDGHSFIEGAAVLDARGRRVASQAAVIDDSGEPLPRQRLAELEQTHPWLKDPWLPDYGFVIKALSQDPEAGEYVSPIIDAPDRKVLVVASPRLGPDGKLAGAVMHQLAINTIWRNMMGVGAKGLDFWLMDHEGNIGLNTTRQALLSAQAFAASSGLEAAVKRGLAAADEGLLGASGNLVQELDGQRAVLNWRTVEGTLVFGVVQTEDALGAVGRRTLRAFGAIALLGLVLVTVVGAVYTIEAIQQERRAAELDTLRRYAGTVSHRVRNNLASLEGSLEIMADERLGPEGLTRALQRADRSVAQIKSTVEELEALSHGDLPPATEGQAGRDTMYKTGGEPGGES